MRRPAAGWPWPGALVDLVGGAVAGPGVVGAAAGAGVAGVVGAAAGAGVLLEETGGVVVGATAGSCAGHIPVLSTTAAAIELHLLPHVCIPPFISPRLSNKANLEYAVEAAADFLNKAVKPMMVGGPKFRVAKAKKAFAGIAESSGPLVALAYPLYASVKAIETKSPVDDQQWLTYWVMYSLITLFELTFASIIQWLPFWPSMKLIFICWLVLPYFNGAAFVYQNYVRPMFVKHQMVNIWYVPQKKGLFGKSDDFLTALDKFIEENGPEALKKLTNKAGKSSKQSGKSWKDSKSSKESKDSKSSKESKEPKPSKDSKQLKPPKVSKESKPLKDSKEDKKAVKEDKKVAAKDSKEQKKALKDSKELKKALKDSKEQGSQKDSDELKPKSNKRVTFAEVEPEKELKASNSDWHPTSEYHSVYPEHNSWSSSFMIFEDENSYWN